MNRSVKLAILLTIAASSCAYPVEQIHSMEHLQDSWIKAENGLIIAWRVGSQNADANQIDIFDPQGNALVRLSILRIVPEAKGVSIYDVSARPGRLIAVAGVYASRQPGVRPAAALLYFDFKGQLLSFFALAPSREIALLAIDDELNVWTLTHGTGAEGDPAKLSMVVEYDAAGRDVRELLKRDMFPYHARFTQENPKIGSVAGGYDSGFFWFWLPGSTELVTVRASNGTAVVTKTGLPQPPGGVIPQRLLREGSGAMVAEVLEEHQPGDTYYRWSPSTNLWTQFRPDPCKYHRLVGVNDQGQIYIRAYADGSEICTYSRQ